ncbi:hypothetical protein GCM10010347_66180 [Streptomyces cirratus]|uniref:Uncharacterized protein n=1 Tax=Streptomyces cirratus TaxID=68187 RepID=A0ABQ3F5R5_9ACTN|nr:hypothetical protein [Streptomyces cirratus]GHB85944.1 hypothetical protein GCM10010347_66180 [Streptomyces cirratus]
MTWGAAILPRDLRQEITDAIKASEPAWLAFVEDNREAAGGQPLAVKYVPARYATTYRKLPNKGLFIGSSNFTWGRGVYVTGVQEPLSTAIYGRVGVVSRFDPSGWKVFDARDPANEQLYLRWLHTQPTYPEAVVTVHSNYWLHRFRNQFREQFEIDVVLFHPDEKDAGGWYTYPRHTWMAVSDWESRQKLSREDYSTRFVDVWLTILIEEEFTPDTPALTRTPHFMLSGGAPAPLSPVLVRNAYRNNAVVRVES